MGVEVAGERFHRGPPLVALVAFRDRGRLRDQQVGAHLAGQDVKTFAVSGEWKRLAEIVEIKEEARRASLGIWSATPQARVWIDDVEVRAVR